jgi:hypothetical protein
MTDIVERLREAANGIGSMKTERGDYGLLDEAADEIERLRGLLKPFAVYYEINDLDERLADDAIEVPVGDLRAVYRVIGARAAQMDGEG